MHEHPLLTQKPSDVPQETTSGNAATRIAEFEEVILLAVAGLANETHGPAIRNRLETAGRKVAVGALYTTLQCLAQKRLVTSWLGEATAHAGGRAKTYYSVTSRGWDALQDAERVCCALRGSSLPARPAEAEDKDLCNIADTESRLLDEAHEDGDIASFLHEEELSEPQSQSLPQPQPMTPVTPQPNLQPPQARPDYLDYYTSR